MFFGAIIDDNRLADAFTSSVLAARYAGIARTLDAKGAVSYNRSLVQAGAA
jgi:hypothetical protein